MGFLNTKKHEKSEGPAGAREIIPDGWYPFELIDHEYLTTRAGDGKRVKAVFECVHAEYAGAKIFHNWNAVNKSEKAVQISKDQIFDICQALDVTLEIEDPAELAAELNKLMDAPIDCLVATEKGVGTFRGDDGEERQRADKNKILAFRRYNGDKTEAPKQRGRLTR